MPVVTGDALFHYSRRFGAKSNVSIQKAARPLEITYVTTRFSGLVSLGTGRDDIPGIVAASFLDG